MSAAAVLAALCVSSCQSSVPEVPVTNRKIVPPKGTTEVEKSWSRPTQQEGDNILGPLSNARR